MAHRKEQQNKVELEGARLPETRLPYLRVVVYEGSIRFRAVS